MPKEEKYLTVRGVMEMLDVSRTTVYNWTKNKLLNPVHIEGITRYRKSEIEKLINQSHENENTNSASN